MAYFIGNGSVKIGGGSLGRTEQMPTLKLLCVDLCARHLDRLSNLGDMPTEVFIDLLKRAKGKATPELVQRLQDQNEKLLCDEVDVAFWKQAVEDHILRRTVPAPGPVLVERANELKQRLAELREKETASELPKGWSQDVIAVLKALEELPASVGLLRETLIGKAVGPLRKAANAEVARLATDLVARWKEAARSNAPEQQSASSSSSKFSNGIGGGRDGAGAEGDEERSAVEVKQRAVERGFRCRTWNALHQHLEFLRGEKVRASSKRAREAREREQQKRPKMIVGSSKREDFQKRRTAISTTGCGNFSNISRSNSNSNSNSNKSSGGSRYLAARGSSRGLSPSPSQKKTPKKSSGSGSGSGRGGGNKITSIAELRRKVVIDQRLSAPVNPDRRGGPAVTGRSPPPKRSKFFK